jgi:dihydrofolate reductase
MGSASGALLLGRRTYEDFFGFWPKQSDGNPFTAALDAATKYVASTTLTEPLPWQNSVLLRGDAVAAVADLKRDTDLTVLGSGELVRTLAAAGLVDEYLLLVAPLLLGQGDGCSRRRPGAAAADRMRADDDRSTDHPLPRDDVRQLVGG